MSVLTWRQFVALATVALPGMIVPAWGQEAAPAPEAVSESASDGEVEEILVTGRQKQAATDVLQERMELPVVADLIDSEQISRVGDSSVSLALRRLPGVTLVGDQFIYVRGLGERYSSVTVNGAYVPSLDLTRNVIPLDIFPAEIIDSLSVTKGYTVDLPAAFGGGNIDIRTRAIPDDLVLDMQAGTGWDSESSENALQYSGGGDDWLGTDDGGRQLSSTLRDAINTYQGDVSPTGILRALQRDGGSPTIQQAEAVNRQLATSLSRDAVIAGESTDPDISLEGSVGNSWRFGDGEEWQFGVLAQGDYKNQWRNRDRTNRSVLTPDTVFTETQRSVNNVALTGSLNLGLRWNEEHEVKATNLYLRNTDDEAAISTGFNGNFQQSQGLGTRSYQIRYEERDLELLQLAGSHSLGDDTLGLLSEWVNLDFARDLKFSWFYSESTAETDIPNELTVSAVDRVDPDTAAVLSTSVRSSGSAADYRFTELEDDVTSWGWTLAMPLEIGSFGIEVSGGLAYYEKGRSYIQTQFGLGTTAIGVESVLAGTPADVFTDENVLNPANGFILSLGGIGTESYLAGETIDAAFGQVDVRWTDSWRFTGGVRYEDFARVSVPVDPLQFDTGVGKIPIPIDQLVNAATAEDDLYPALAITYMREDFWAEDFQLRLGWSQTTARPDLREVANTTYIDPLTEARIRGNPNLETSALNNVDLRAEWFFATGDNLTLSLFWKDIKDPIETIEGAGSDDNLALTFINAESAEIYGLEIEGLKQLGFLAGALGDWTDSFFLAGNITVADSELIVGDGALNLTNNERSLTQQADRVANLQLGFDSPGGMHNAALVYNLTGERLFFAGRAGAPDAYEQPFTSLDLVYSIYPTSQFSVKFRLQNLLDENIEIDQGGVTVLEQEIGVVYKIDATWRM